MTSPKFTSSGGKTEPSTLPSPGPYPSLCSTPGHLFIKQPLRSPSTDLLPFVETLEMAETDLEVEIEFPVTGGVQANARSSVTRYVIQGTPRKGALQIRSTIIVVTSQRCHCAVKATWPDVSPGAQLHSSKKSIAKEDGQPTGPSLRTPDLK
ncbi:hypothetical protein MG293_014415 [Ovis ammon polii]|uniref:Uncharacterized protein n=1 Tax=Ovis ammon polii TaxID=230172 RepID=A0AAD4TZL3_OVIAM|nr:hypothetical protein MG293_014415 [Ovis ammon polii]